MSWHRSVALAAALLALAAAAMVCADPDTPELIPETVDYAPSGENPASSELLLFQEIPEVVTAAKEAQPLTESPSTISVITADDIRRSGATTIPDILRMVPGLEVMEVTASDFDVSARGFDSLLAHRMLVLVDGRSVYQDMLGVTLWETLPLILDEIQRIEIVRGPGSALYGANAFDGVINIITRTPQETPALQVTQVVGTQDLAISSLVHAGRFRSTDYKFSLAADRLNAWNEGASVSAGLTPISHDFTRWNGTVQRTIGSGVVAAYAGGSDGHLQLLPDEAWGTIDYNSELRYWQIVYGQPDLLVRGFWNHGEQVVLSDLDDWVEFDTYDLEVQKSLQVGRDHSFIIGGNWRRNRVHLSAEQDYTQRIYGAYVQDRYTTDHGLSIVGGLRADHHPLTGDHVSPRASVVYSPRAGESYRLSVATAYRNPSFFESYLDLRQREVMPGVDLWWHGNDDLGAERITSYEAGYQVVVNRRLRWEVDGFFNKLDDFIVKTMVAGPPDLEFTYVNSGGATARGLETELEYVVSPRLRAFANYSYQHVTDDATGARIGSAPRNKLNAGLRYTRSRLEGDLVLDHVSSTEWDQRFLPAYTLVNGRIGYVLPGQDLELFLAAFNLFKDSHREYPTGALIGRRITAGIHYRF